MGDATPRGRALTHRHAQAGASAQRARIAAARVVTYDAQDRTPDQRAAMLEGIGLTRIIWDWREEHALRFDAEMDALERHGIDVAGLWCPMPLAEPDGPDADAALGIVDPQVRIQVAELARRGMRPDLWTCVEFGQEGSPARLAPRIQRARVLRVANHLEPLATLAREHDMCVLLTNHLGWFGEPGNQVDVIDALADRGLTNVGIAYQFQHGHDHAARFDAVLDTMLPHLAAIALSGMDADAIQTGRKILPWGAGRLDRKLAHLLMASGWEGQIAVQGHSADDAEARLLDSLEGIEWMLDRWRGVRHARPVPRIATPAWPAPAGVPGPYMGMSLMSRRLRRRLVDEGRMAPTAARVRTAPPEPAPITLPPAAVPVTPPAELPARGKRGRRAGLTAVPTLPTPATAASAGSAPSVPSAPEVPAASAPAPGTATPPRRSRGGAAGAMAAIHAAREEIDHASTPRRRKDDRGSIFDVPRRGKAPQEPAAASALSDRTLDGPAAGEPAYQPSGTTDSGQLPMRIAHRDVTLEAPDPYTGAIHALLTHLESVGFRGAPRSFGWDGEGRHLVEWVDGTRCDHPEAPADALDPVRVGAFMREMHDALATFEPPADAQWFEGLPGPGGDLVIHQDIAPSNLVIAGDGRLVAIDWDAAAPGTRLWDIAHAIHAIAPLHGEGFDLPSQAARLAGFADGYGLTEDQREELLPLLALRSERMYEYLAQMRATGQSPWLELWERGVGAVWEADAKWIRDHEPQWRDALLGDITAA
ncbi:phosphotransferase [uncultured Demequina sp.]|uniref:phosphotransferase n=1 Tax=uncultured Demequina sp. TaxID=693499 RepID=UPI0025EFFAB0|nr:phosphotransferase [uncultured Demequina sp.]